MKVVIPLLRFGRSGGERVISKLATGLINEGHDVIFVVPNGSGQPYYETDAKIVTYESSKAKSKLFRWFFNCLAMLACCKSINPNAVIATYHQVAYIAFMLPSNIKKFYYIQAYEVNFYKSLIKKTIAAVTYILPLKKIVNSDLILPRPFNNYIACIPAGIDYDLFYRARTNELGKVGKINIGLIGRAEKYKGTLDSLDAIFEYINSNDLDEEIIVNVAIHVPSEYRNKGIIYHEINNDKELANFYKSNDIVVAVGLVEFGAFHYPCAEAMTSGCLTISNYAPLTKTNSSLKILGFSKELIIEKLSSAISSIKENTHLCEIKRNQNVMAEYSWEKICKNFNSSINGF